MTESPAEPLDLSILEPLQTAQHMGWSPTTCIIVIAIGAALGLIGIVIGLVTTRDDDLILATPIGIIIGAACGSLVVWAGQLFYIDDNRAEAHRVETANQKIVADNAHDIEQWAEGRYGIALEDADVENIAKGGYGRIEAMASDGTLVESKEVAGHLILVNASGDSARELPRKAAGR